jgi:spermidine synthase
LYATGIGLLIGLEIPLVARMNEAYEALRTNVASVMEKDYYGALVGGLLFAFFALPKLGLTYTPIALGVVNFVVASVLLWQYRDLLHRRRRLTAAFWTTAAGLVALVALIRPIVLFGEQSRYRDRVVYEDQTRFQRIVITEWKGYHWLFLDSKVQFSTYDEERYHEPLVHPALRLAASRGRVLVLGGGDGLAAREVLKHDDVTSVTLVDLDPAITELAKTHPALRVANAGALADQRVEVVNADAGRYLEEAEGLYDVIVIDLPDPRGPNLARLYSKEFYLSCRRHLARYGTLVTQSTSPLHARSAFLCIDRTLRSAGFSTMPYHNAIPTMGDWGFILAMKADVISSEVLRKRAEGLDFSGIETRFLDRDAMAGMLHFWKGMFDSAETISVSTELEPTVDRYYREAEWGW